MYYNWLDSVADATLLELPDARERTITVRCAPDQYGALLSEWYNRYAPRPIANRFNLYTPVPAEVIRDETLPAGAIHLEFSKKT